MQSIFVNLPQKSYQILIAPGLVSDLGQQLKQLKLGSKVILVTNQEIHQAWGLKVVESLSQEGYQVHTHLIPAGENYKTPATVQAIYDVAFKHQLERNSSLIALGGGVIGDLTGFAAATWLRGINFIQVPTSLLAMVDASIGGKTGVNHPQGKNLIGAFYQPKIVIIDPLVLKTLPPREFRAGMAEVIKYGVIQDHQLFTTLEEADQLANQEEISAEFLYQIISRSAQAKVAVVTEDEQEAGIRAILNYGHTLGHAIESLTGYQLVNHGEAVAIGMILAGEIAVQMGLWTHNENLRQKQLITKAGLPTQVPKGIDPQAMLASLKNDKKVKDGLVQFILPKAIGTVIITNQVPSELIIKVISENFED